MIYNQPVGGAANDPYVTGVPGVTPGSIPPGGAIEQPQREILAVIAAAGLTPSSVNLTQLLSALRSTGVFTTPAQYDSSTKAATTEYANRVGLNAGAVIGIYSNTTLNAGHGGQSIYCGNGAIPITITLSSASSVRRGTRISIYNIFGDTGGTVTVQRQGYDNISVPWVMTVFVLKSGGWCVLESDGINNWFVVDRPGLGYGQTYESVSRGLGFTYYNDTIQPILSIFSANGNADFTCGHRVNGIPLPGFVSSEIVQSQQFTSVAIIPPGSSYALLSNGTYQGSYELR